MLSKGRLAVPALSPFSPQPGGIQLEKFIKNLGRRGKLGDVRVHLFQGMAAMQTRRLVWAVSLGQLPGGRDSCIHQGRTAAVPELPQNREGRSCTTPC